MQQILEAPQAPHYTRLIIGPAAAGASM